MYIPKLMTKVSVNITVDGEVISEFRRKCRMMDIKVSTKINSLMREWNARMDEGKV